MNIVIVAYRPDHTDVCRGCVMGSTGSDMEHGVFDNIEEAANFLAYYMKENEVRDMYSFAEYEFTYIINGIDYEDADDKYDFVLAGDLEALARKKTDELVEIYNTAEEERMAKVKADKEKAEQQRELATLARLQQKHGKL